MEKIKEKLTNTWKAITYPDGLDEEYDCKCDDAFLRFLDKVNIFCWILYSIFASISIYLLITREIL